MYALTGASGQLGRLVTKHLLTLVPAEQIVATTRNPEGLIDLSQQGVVVRRVDFSDPLTLASAFAGVDRLLIISTDAIGSRVAQHRAAIEAAVAAGVQHLIYTSAIGADANASSTVAEGHGAAERARIVAQEHGATEALLAASRVAWTALRNSAYAEALPALLAPLQSGDDLYLPAGDATVSWVTREDCARTAAHLLVSDAPLLGPLDVTGPEALSFAEIAARLATLGRRVTIRVLSETDLTAVAVAGGLPERAATFVIGTLAFIAQTGEGAGAVTDTVEVVSGIPATPVDAVLRLLVSAS